MPDFTLHDMADATAILEQMRTGKLSSKKLVQASLDRLHQVNPHLNAATQVFNGQALAAAENPIAGPLSGLPITLKETYALAKEQVTVGSVRMPAIQCKEDAPVVKRLKAAGAIIIARSNIPEFVMTAETSNLRFGRSNHPKDQTRVPGGSTGGEGALVASGVSLIGFGTDILGSIRIPAAFCGLVGFRPHSAAVNKSSVYPESGPYFETFNGIGPITRSVRDARLAYSVIANEPPALPATISGLKLIAPKNYPFEAKDECIDTAYRAALEGLQTAGMVKHEPVLDDIKTLFMNVPKLVTGEMVSVWKDWLSVDGKPFSIINETLRQITGRPTVQPGFFLWLSLINGLYRPRQKTALTGIIETYEHARKNYRTLLGHDALLCLPTIGMLAPKHGAMNRATLMKPGLNKQITAHTLVNMLDLSGITVPARGFSDPKTGLVPGIMLASAPGNEGALLDAAAALEQALL
ncbi:amidase [Alteromonas genovensis]|uniref:amidase n=1 Tax=Alteromonas genovensis TaxID=471225 RepID=UPI002FE0A3CD